jgi:hypothetical protein
VWHPTRLYPAGWCGYASHSQFHNFTYSLISFHSAPCYVSRPIQNLKYSVTKKLQIQWDLKACTSGQWLTRSGLVVVQVVSLQQWPTLKMRSLSDTQRKLGATNLTSLGSKARGSQVHQPARRRSSPSPMQISWAHHPALCSHHPRLHMPTRIALCHDIRA